MFFAHRRDGTPRAPLLSLLAFAGCGGGGEQANPAGSPPAVAGNPGTSPTPPVMEAASAAPATGATAGEAPKPSPARPPADLTGDDPKEVARVFLKSEDMAVHMALMTEKARRAHEENNFTTQQKTGRRFEYGEVTVDGDTAEVAVKGEGFSGRMEPGIVKLRREEGAWRVHALTMAATEEHPEMTMDFENPMAMFGELGVALSELGDAMEGFGKADPAAEALALAEEAAKEAARFEALEAVDLDAFRDSFKMDVDLDARPAGEAITELAAPLGLALDRSEAPADALDRPVTLRAEGLTRLEAIERICEAVGLYASYGAAPTEEFPDEFAGDAVTPQPGPRPLPVAFAGPFLVEVTGVKQDPTGTGTLNLRVLGLGLPAATKYLFEESMFAPLLTQGSDMFLVETIRGIGGQSLLDREAGMMWSEASGPHFFEKRFSASMQGLLRKDTAIDSVQGKIVLPVPSRLATVRFDEVVPGASRDAGGVAVALQGTRSAIGGPTGEGLELQVGTNGPSAPTIPGEPPSTEGTVFAWVARDADGRPLAADFGLSGFMGHSATIDTSATVKPAVIEVKVFQKLELITLTFKINQIPLKDFARMPVALETLDFAGHDAPVSGEFVRFLEKDQQQNAFPNARPPYLVRIVNHSNKDVRRLVMKATFLDASGKALQSGPPLNFNSQPHLVQRQDEKEMRESGFFVPQGAASATFRALEVGFTDGTAWKAPEN